MNPAPLSFHVLAKKALFFNFHANNFLYKIYGFLLLMHKNEEGYGIFAVIIFTQ
jgi:hypothetical protein